MVRSQFKILNVGTGAAVAELPRCPKTDWGDLSWLESITKWEGRPPFPLLPPAKTPPIPSPPNIVFNEKIPVPPVPETPLPPREPEEVACGSPLPPALSIPSVPYKPEPERCREPGKIAARTGTGAGRPRHASPPVPVHTCTASLAEARYAVA